MLFVLIFLGAELAGWALCAYLPWLVVSIATHGEAGLGMLALCLFVDEPNRAFELERDRAPFRFARRLAVASL